ncbi:Ger(x)C family spore germination protein [Cytobacillus depressus]|uniref:Ger(X)C family spore germination protein n=1 Tax=Cytobacillus depressus TaxID=1602942 RepID=A0A6L3UZK8_9BACI|nr:Ger(x)C family spore germination protein [Cytobacillus depressus]KAB2330145.1 Ger(x)C family spore germination protein [Cytobacillus depressus]
MSRRSIFCYVFCFCIIFTTGCWDRKELNDRAIWLATGFDFDEKKDLQFSGQIVVPSLMQSQNGGGGAAKEFLTISSNGKNVNDSMQNIQEKLSRKEFSGQRRVVFFGEEFAKHGIKNHLDVNSRSHEVSIRTDVFVVKEGTAKEALNLNYPLEKPPATATIKAHKEAGGRGDKAFLNFLIAANSDGIRPTLPVVEMGNFDDGENKGQESSSKSILRLAGLAIFNEELELIGYLNNQENRHFLWVMGNLKNMTISAPVKDGSASLNLTKLKSDIVPEISRNKKLRFVVKLTGEGSLLENNSNLDLVEPKNIKDMQRKFEKRVKKQIHKTITKAQKEYGEDIFGFGETIRKKHPGQWKSLNKEWDNLFSEAEVSVQVNLKIKRIGMTGPSLLYKESEIKK